MSTLKALIFDVDGTMADTERDGHRVAFNMAFKDAELDWNWDVDLYGKLLAVTGGKERILYFLKDFHPGFSQPKNMVEFVAELHKAKTKHYTDLLDTGAIPLRSGVRRLLDLARSSDLRLAIATTTTPANVSGLLRNTLGAEGESWFEVIAAGDIVPQKKPASDIYLYTLRKLNLKPEACVAFEDSENGMRSSHAANLNTIITINDYTRDHDFREAALVVDCFGEPDQPFHLISGNAHGSEYVDLKLLEKICQ